MFFLAAAADPSVFMFLKLELHCGSLCVPPVCKCTQPSSPRCRGYTARGSTRGSMQSRWGRVQSGCANNVGHLRGAQDPRGHLPTKAPSSPGFYSRFHQSEPPPFAQASVTPQCGWEVKVSSFSPTHLHIHILGKALLLSENGGRTPYTEQAPFHCLLFLVIFHIPKGSGELSTLTLDISFGGKPVI